MPAQSSPDMPSPSRQDGAINETNSPTPSSGLQSPSPSQLAALSPPVRSSASRGDMAADGPPQQPRRESLARSPASTESMHQNPSPSASTSDLKDRRSSDRNRFSFSSLYSLGSTLYTGGPDKNPATIGSAIDDAMKPVSSSLGSPSNTESSPPVASPASGSTGNESHPNSLKLLLC
jgi:hypothetical protein